MSEERVKTMKTLMSIGLLLLIGASAFADEAGHLSVRTVVQKEVTLTDAGETETKLVPADSVVPGEKVVYTIAFTNISGNAAADVVITNPIADSLTYVEGSAFGPGTEIQFSIDGGNTFASRDDLAVIEAGVSRAANADDLTHIRWVMREELATGAQGTARFSAVLK